MNKKELTVREARAEYGYSKQMLYNLLDSGAIKSRKIGWIYLIDRKSLEAYIAAHGRSTRGQTRMKVGHEAA